MRDLKEQVQHWSATAPMPDFADVRARARRRRRIKQLAGAGALIVVLAATFALVPGTTHHATRLDQLGDDPGRPVRVHRVLSYKQVRGATPVLLRTTKVWVQTAPLDLAATSVQVVERRNRIDYTGQLRTSWEVTFRAPHAQLNPSYAYLQDGRGYLLLNIANRGGGPNFGVLFQEDKTAALKAARSWSHDPTYQTLGPGPEPAYDVAHAPWRILWLAGLLALAVVLVASRRSARRVPS